MPLVASPPYLLINYEGRRRTLSGQWQRSVMPFELHQGYRALLDAADQYACRFWLVDISRRRTTLGSSDVSWLMEEYFPQLQPQLGGTVYLAYLMAPHQLAGMLATPTLPPIPTSQGLPYYFQRFTEEEEARKWLRKCRQQE